MTFERNPGVHFSILAHKKLKNPRLGPNQDFQSHRIDLMVATDAYGQGIDKADIRLIVHWEPPVNLEMRPGLVVGVGPGVGKSHGEIFGPVTCAEKSRMNFGGFGKHSFPG